MSSAELCFMPATEMAAAIREKQLLPVEIIDAVYERIHVLNPKLNAFCTLTEESARESAREAEAAVMPATRWAGCTACQSRSKNSLITKGRAHDARLADL